MNHSPWIAQLKRTRPIEPLEENLETDVVIVGGGIAGITTAYFLLKNTDKRVVLLEAGKVAHGATGHNAGQITSYFEMTIADMVEKFGFDKAISAQKIIEEDARVIMEKIFIEAQIRTPKSEFIGHDGLTTKDQIEMYLEDLLIREKSNVLSVRKMLISRDWLEENDLDEKYNHVFTPTSPEDIGNVLETNDPSYIAAIPFLSGCTNSALFSEELAGYLLANYKTRFILKEHTLVSKIILNKDDATVEAGLNIVDTIDIVLCTNGFESLEIINHAGDNIDGEFHHEVMGVIGYMSAYKEKLSKPPFAGTYTHDHPTEENPYFYVTRRPYEDESDAKHNLVCVGGPQHFLPDRATYDTKKEYPTEVDDEIGTFILQTYEDSKKEMSYKWHGLMGYTTSGVRLIGRENKNGRLLYNLGCNGVGILTSIYGAERISKILRGDALESTVFDPK
jgi:glycine/D-amino acid oxidase-like deaminating enzyme